MYMYGILLCFGVLFTAGAYFIFARLNRKKGPTATCEPLVCIYLWRREWDSNPRNAQTFTRFRVARAAFLITLCTFQ